MPKSISVQNNFIHGLVTEATGLTFPENACTDTSNCVFSLIGDVTRRLGINYEANFNNVPAGLSGQSVSTFRWINAGGDGETEILVVQEGAFLVFFTSSLSTVSNPLSHHLQAAVIDMSGFQATGNTNSIAATEAQFATGNGYLFVFHPDCDPFYCTYSEGAVTGNVINVQTRDFLGFYPEPGNPGINFRPSSLTAEHQYNLQNQGWTGTPPWTAVSNSANLEITPSGQPQNNIQVNTGSQTFTVASGISGVVPGSTVTVGWSVVAGRVNVITGADSFLVAGSSAIATVVSYTGTSLVLDIIQNNPENSGPGFSWIALQVPTFSISPGVSNNTLASFKTASGLYPSNSDIWYTFKDSTGTFNPTDTFGNVVIASTPEPR